MRKRILTFTAFTSAMLIAITGCTPNTFSDNISADASSPAEVELSNATLNNLDNLASRAVPILDNYDFRETMKIFLISGEKTTEYDEKFKDLSNLVSHDEIWKVEKQKLLELIEQGKVPVAPEDAGVYLDSLVVDSVFKPENINEISTIPVYSFDISAFSPIDSNGEMSWSKIGGLGINDANNMVYSVITPSNNQYFAKNGSLLSARNAIENLNQPITETEAKKSLRSMVEQINNWLTSTGLPQDESTSIENLAPEILNIISIPTDLTTSDQPSTSITGNTKNYKITIIDGDKEYSITSTGEISIPESLANKPSLDLPITDLKKGWDAYKAKSQLDTHNNSKATIDKIVDSLNKENTDQGVVWETEKIDGNFYVAYIKDGTKKVFA